MIFGFSKLGKSPSLKIHKKIKKQWQKIIFKMHRHCGKGLNIIKKKSTEEERMNACCPIFKENLHKEQDVCFSTQKKQKGNSFYVYL